MNKKEVLCTSGGVLAGFGLASLLFIPRPTRDVTAPVSFLESSKAAELRKENEELRKKNDELAAARPILSAERPVAETGDPKSEAIARLNVLVGARRLGMRADFPVLNRRGEVDKNFCELFGLTSAEGSAVEEAVRRGREELGRLELAHSTREKLEGGGVTIKIQAFAEAGGKVYDTVMAVFAETLGPERNSAFTTLCSEPLERSMWDFGAAERVVTVKADAKHKGGYSLKVESQKPDSSSTITSQVKDQAELAGQIGELTQHLQDDWR